MLKVTRQTDPELANLVDEELSRQEHNIEMIASESTAPLAVMELTGSVFTNKTLEGYPGALGSIQLHTMAAKCWSFKYAATDEFKAIMNAVADAPNDEENLAACKAKAQALIARFPLYPEGAFED